MPEADPQPNAKTPGHSPFAEQLGRSPFADQLRVPQFGIIHLLIWSAVTAVLLKYYLAMMDEPIPHGSVMQFRAMRGLQCVYAIVLASTLTGSGVLIRARCYVAFKRLQPGHWIVLIVAIGSILHLAAWPLYRFSSGVGMTSMWMYLVSTATISTSIVAAYVCAIVQLRDAKRWKVLLGAKALGEGATAALSWLSLIMVLSSGFQYQAMIFSRSIQGCSSIGRVAIFILLLVVVALDFPRRASRDWLHWLGVGTFGLTYAIGFAWEVCYAFFRQTAL